MPPATIDDYLAGVPDDTRGALERLRAQIHAAAPDATETITYGMPGFKLDGRYFVGFSASKAHCLTNYQSTRESMSCSNGTTMAAPTRESIMTAATCSGCSVNGRSAK